MKQTFIYKEKFAFSYCYPAIAFIALAIAAGVFKYGIAIKNLHLLEYPYSVYILSICAIGFVAYACSKYSSAKKSAQNPNPIEVDDNGITFPSGNGSASVLFADVKNLWFKNDEDDGKQVIIYTSENKRHEFSEDNFTNPSEFAEFERIMSENCNNIAKG